MEAGGATHFASWRLVLRVIGLAALIVAALWLMGMRVGHRPIWSDAESYSIPKYEMVAERIAEGSLPLWNPYEFGGMPLLATMQPAALYPPVWAIYGWLEPLRAHAALFAFHLGLAALCTLALARRLGCAPWPATLAALWVLNPWVIARLYDMPIHLGGLAWVPLIVLLAREVVLRPSARSAAGLGAAAALQLFSGYGPFPLATAYVCLIALPFWLVESGSLRDRRALSRAACGLLVAAAIAFCLGSLLLLPTLEQAGMSARAESAKTVEAMVTASADVGRGYLKLLGVPPITPVGGLVDVFTSYGPILLALIALGAALHSLAPSGWAIYALAAVSSLVPFVVFKSLPFYGLVRFAAEWTYMSTFFIYLAAALGLEAIRCRWRISRRWLAVIVLLALGVGTLWTADDVRSIGVWRLKHHPMLKVPPLVAKECDIDVAGSRLFWPRGARRGAGLIHRVPSIGGYEQSLMLERVFEVQSALQLPTGSDRKGWLKSIADHPRVASRMGLGCVLSKHRSAALVEAGFERLPSRSPNILYRNTRPLPRVRLVREIRVARSPEAALDLLLSEKIDPATSVILEEGQNALAACGGADERRAEIVDYAEEEVRIEAETSCAAYLVLSDTHTPGWEVEVDAVVRPVEIADYLFRAVRLDPGLHEVVFRYRPRSVRIARWIGLVGALGAIALALLPRRLDPFSRLA